MLIKKLLIICLTTFSLPAFAQYHFIKSEEGVSEFELDNGLKVILAPNKDSNQVFMSTTYFTGSLNDPQGKSGLAHLLEHLAFKGTKEVDEKSFLQRLQKNTLYQNAYTTFDRTSYINRIQPNQQAIDEVVYLEAQRMGALDLKIQNVPTEIEIVRREREGRLDNPSVLLIEKLYQKLYGDQFYGRSLIGNLNELQSITQRDLDHFYQTWYAPNNAVIVLTGNFNQTQVIQSIDQKFSYLSRKNLPVIQPIPKVNINHSELKDIVVEKGSHYVKNNIYFSTDTPKSKQNLLSVIPSLFTIRPTGILYKNIEEKGIATDVGMSLQSNNDFNIAFVSAVYAPNHDEKLVSESLLKNVEQPAQFTPADLDRIKKILKNSLKTNELSPEALNGILQTYVVQHHDWQLYFKHKEEISSWTISDVNQLVNKFFIPEHRISASIKPSVQVSGNTSNLNLKNPEVKNQAETSSVSPDDALKTPEEYAQETQQNIIESREKLTQIESKIHRGEMTSGIKYAFYPTTTFDQKVYASIDMHFGTAESLKNQQANLSMMANLLYKGSQNISQQQLLDQSIALDGQSYASASDNGLRILIVANQDHFIEYFKYMMRVLKTPLFPQSEFNLIQQQALSALNRPYTEPNILANLTINRLTENYQPGDLRYHFEPELQKKQIQAATRNDVVKLYQQFFAFDHADIAVTGNYNIEVLKPLLEKTLMTWKKNQPYEVMANAHEAFPAQQVHVKSEKTESGSYIGIMQLPVGAYDPDSEALFLIREILSGSQQTSRLTKALRENKQLVYGATSNLSLDSHSHTGMLQIAAQYKSGYSTQISKTVHDVLSDLITHGVTERELELAKLKMIKSRNNSVDDSRRVHRMLNSQLELNQNMAHRIERERKISSLTTAEIDAVIRKYIKLDQYVEVSSDEYGTTQAL